MIIHYSRETLVVANLSFPNKQDKQILSLFCVITLIWVISIQTREGLIVAKLSFSNKHDKLLPKLCWLVENAPTRLCPGVLMAVWSAFCSPFAWNNNILFAIAYWIFGTKRWRLKCAISYGGESTVQIVCKWFKILATHTMFVYCCRMNLQGVIGVLYDIGQRTYTLRSRDYVLWCVKICCTITVGCTGHCTWSCTTTNNGLIHI